MQRLICAHLKSLSLVNIVLLKSTAILELHQKHHLYCHFINTLYQLLLGHFEDHGAFTIDAKQNFHLSEYLLLKSNSRS